MAHCDEYTQLISAALDGALSPADQARLDAHLARCPQCRALMEDFQTLHAALLDLPPAEPPAGLTDRIMAAVAADNVTPLVPAAKKSAAFRWKRWAASAAVVAIVLVGAYRMDALPSAPKAEEAVQTLPDPTLPATQTPLFASDSLGNADPDATGRSALPPETSAPTLFSGAVSGDTRAQDTDTSSAAQYSSAQATPLPSAQPDPTPAPFALMNRSVELPVEGQDLPAPETIDPSAAIAPFSLQPEAGEGVPEVTLETAPETDVTGLLTNGLPDNGTQNPDWKALPEESPLTPQDALELAVQTLLEQENPTDPEREPLETEDGSPACLLRWSEGETDCQYLLRYSPQEQEPNVYYIDCIWESSDGDAGAFLYLVDKTTGTVSTMCTD